MTEKFSPIETELEQLLDRTEGIDETTKEVMLRHNGFNCKSREKLEDIANDFGVTKEAVRQRSIKGIERINDLIRSSEAAFESLKSAVYAGHFLEACAPCSEEDAQHILYMEGCTDRKDIDIEALLYMLEQLTIQVHVTVIKEGKRRFVVKTTAPNVVKDIVKKAREEVTTLGASTVNKITQEVSIGHKLASNQTRLVVAALEAQSDFVWLTGADDERGNGFFLLKKAGRNPVELRLRRIFSVRKKCNMRWLHSKIARSRKAMKNDVDIPPEAVAQIGVEKGICKPTKDPEIFERAEKLDPKQTMKASMEYRIWEFLKKNPESRDSDIMAAIKERETDRFNIRSKLNFSVVIQRVSHGVYSAVTDDFPPLNEVRAVGGEGADEDVAEVS